MTDNTEWRTIEGATWADVQDGDRVTYKAIYGAGIGSDIVKVERPVPKVEVELPEELGHYLDDLGYLTTHDSGGWRGAHGYPIAPDLIVLPLSRLYTLSDAAEIIADWLRNYYSGHSANAVRREFVDGAK